MDFLQVKQATDSCYMNVFGPRTPILLKEGKGAKLTDDTGKVYTDFLAGIAVCSLGYGHERIADTLTSYAKKILHCSNLFYTEEQATLAKLLVENTCADHVFFGNSGAEANEAAIKLARKYFYKKGENRFKIITCNNSFHGRTLATVAATGQEKYKTPFLPMPQGFVQVPYKDMDAMIKAVDGYTAAIMVEPIQGEGGVIEGGGEYLNALRELCDEKGILLIFDEIQTGMGRTGKLFAHQAYGVEPDIFTSAKAIANGLPLGACLCKKEVSAFEPGDHGSTFGGNPLACALGVVVMEELLKEGFLQEVARKGALLKDGLNTIAAKYQDKVVEVRGKGLILGMELKEGYLNKELQGKLLERGFITATAGKNTLRLLPPLIIQGQDIEALLSTLEDTLKGWN